jgi:murein L,D-transpeptidase YcbB/YkuD
LEGRLKKLILLLAITWGALYANSPWGAAIAATQSPWKKTLTALYAQNGNKPFWMGAANTDKLTILLDLLDDPYFNYKNKPFNRATIDALLDQLGSDIQPDGVRQKLDVALTDGYLRLLHFVRVGDVNWRLVKRKMARLKATQDVRATWEIHPRTMPGVKRIHAALSSGKIYQLLNAQVPMTHRYKQLIMLLEKYRAMPTPKKIPYGKRLKPHSMDDRIRTINTRLHFFGDFPGNDTGAGWSSSLTRAVRSFKERLNLAKGDYIDNKTILYLNKPQSFYVRKILTNLDILKLYPRALPATRAEVNVPDYQLRYYEGGKMRLKSPLVVGRIDRPTPIFSDKIEYMVLNPTWTITNNLVRRDLIPVLRTNPGYLKSHNIHVFAGGKEVPLNFARLARAEHGGAVPYRFVQYPSDKNALGRVKFMFPNRYSVYLHDTDNHSLFKYRYRVFSSGCMRVGKPFDFMNLLLRHAKGSYSESRIQKILATNKPTTIKLAKPIPVHILYNTVYREGGKDYFLYDIYMYDQMIYESSAGHIKSTFTVPKKRLTGIKRVGLLRRDKKR